MESAVSLKGVTKTYGAMTAVENLELEIPRGALYGFIGPNGAGKTTTIRMIMSIIFPDSGAISILGKASALEAKDRIGYLPEERGVYRRMRVGAFLTYIGRLKGITDPGLPKRVLQMLERFALEGVERKRCEELSKGMLQRVQLIAATIHMPDLLILDEPFSGLDPVSSRLLRDIVLEQHRRGTTVLFSTHVMPQAEEICQSVVMINRGRKVLDAPLSSIRRQYDPKTIEFEPMDPAADLSALQSITDIQGVEQQNGSCKITLADGANTAAAMQRIAAAIAPARLELSRPRLEDVFVRLVSDGQPDMVKEALA